MNPDDLLRVALYESEADAQLAQAALKEQGIDAKLTGNEASALGLSLEGADDIEVIKPQGLRDYLKEKAEKVASQYQTPKKPRRKRGARRSAVRVARVRRAGPGIRSVGR